MYQKRFLQVFAITLAITRKTGLVFFLHKCTHVQNSDVSLVNGTPDVDRPQDIAQAVH